MKHALRCWLAATLLTIAGAASATFHTFRVEQIYSNATGDIQFVILHEALSSNGQELWLGHAFTAGQGGVVTHTYTFPDNLPHSQTSGRRVLVATQGFAALGIVTPDYVIPDGFIPTTNGFVDFAGVSRRTYSSLPTDGVGALYATGAIANNLATNFVGATGSVTLAQANPNHTALWWNPAESGWGINIDHQGDTLFATLFTYDAAGQPLWLVMSNGAKQADGATYTGELFRTTGPAFNAVPFTPIGPANITSVGSMTLAFSGANAATLSYTFNGAPVTKAIQRQVYGSRAATCVPATASRAAATNYQDLWWNAAESGWGVNITHQDNTLFATLFTYDATGHGMWLVMSAGTRQPDGSYLGDLYRTTGSAFNANPFVPLAPENVFMVGTMRLRFSDGENGTLEYTVNGAAVTKQIVRQVFASPFPSCS